MVGGGSSREGRRENLGEGRSRPGSMKGGENGKAADREAGERKVVAGRRGVGEVSARHGVRVLSGAFYPLPPPPGPLSISPQIDIHARTHRYRLTHASRTHTSYLAPYVSGCLPLLALLPSACVGNSTRIEVNMHHTLCDSLLVPRRSSLLFGA